MVLINYLEVYSENVLDFVMQVCLRHPDSQEDEPCL